MAATTFELKGFDGLGKLGDKFSKEVQRQVNAASKIAINKAADQIAYGRVSNIKHNNISSDSAVATAAKALRIPQEHIFYRTFVRNVRVSVSSSRGAKPFSSVMMRANSINVVDLLIRGDSAKGLYGFTSRKRNISAKTKPNIRGIASKARVGGRRGGKVRIAGRVYNNSYLEDGTTRARSQAMENHYVKNLGAKPNSGLRGERFFLFQKKEPNQKLPYPSKVIKIDGAKVQKALDLSASLSVKKNRGKITELQTREVNKRLKKLGFILK